MEQTPSWEASSHSANQEIPCHLWNPKFHSWVCKGLPLAPVLSQMNSVTFPPYFPKSHSNVLPSMSRSSKWSLPLRFSDQNLVYISHLSHGCYIPYTSFFVWSPQQYLVKCTHYEALHYLLRTQHFYNNSLLWQNLCHIQLLNMSQTSPGSLSVFFPYYTFLTGTLPASRSINHTVAVGYYISIHISLY